jgi:hypothetical protein
MDAVMPTIFVPRESIDERTTRELVKLVRKLRWIGREDEAKDLARALGERGGACLVAGLRDTD